MMLLALFHALLLMIVSVVDDVIVDCNMNFVDFDGIVIVVVTVVVYCLVDVVVIVVVIAVVFSIVGCIAFYLCCWSC